MPRTARIKSVTGIYHVILKGINGQIIFEDQEDYLYFLRTLRMYQKEYKFEIYAYCLMNNHVHLLMKEGETSLSSVFKHIGDKFVYYYNQKYNRTGPLFQDRYKAECVEDERYLLTVFRYILQNPQKAGIVQQIKDYPWSNYFVYEGIADQFSNDTFLISFFPSREECIAYLNTSNSDECLEISKQNRHFISDGEAQKIILNITKMKYTTDVQNINQNNRNYYIKEMKKQGLSVRQISRLTGISKSVIGRA